jgi:hypothetical protein
MWHHVFIWCVRIAGGFWALGVLVVLACYTWLRYSAKKEVAGYPRASMLLCDKHGPVQIGKETLTIPDIRTEDGQPIPICLYCYYESSKAMDKKLKEAKQGL